ncbi:MAG: hypothetical protein GF307_10550 [candidate division Zixibacteria bacterium]|nr:hypothetical protein [candidate division Zixibacteria bacterium]
MKRALILLFLILSLSQSDLLAVTETELDSLWIRASSGGIRFRDEVQPAKDALVEHGEEAVDYLVDKMDTRGAREMHTLVDILGKIGSPAVDEVCGQLNSDDFYRVRLATRVLGRIGDSTAVDCLLPHAGSPEYNIRSGVASALGKIGHSSAVETLKELSRDEDYLVRKSAVVALGKMPFDKVKEQLILCLSDDYYGVRYSAGRAFAGYEDGGAEESAEYLKDYVDEFLDKKEPFSDIETLAVTHAIETLGTMEYKDARGLFKDIIKSDRTSIIRGYAVRGLGKVGKESDFRMISKLVKYEPDYFVKSMMLNMVKNH